MSAVPGSEATIGEPQRSRVLTMAARKNGVCVVELVEALGVSKFAVIRYVKRLVREGALEKTNEKRRRLEVLGVGHPGAPATIYRALRRK